MAKILIVEDDQFTRELYQSFLKDVGHEVDVAADGESGLTEMVKVVMIWFCWILCCPVGMGFPSLRR